MGKRRCCSCCCSRGLTKTRWKTTGTPLSAHHSSRYDHTPAALSLLAAGADVSLGYGRLFKRLLVHMAAQLEEVDVLRAAIEHGADVNDGGTTDNITPFIVPHATTILSRSMYLSRRGSTSKQARIRPQRLFTYLLATSSLHGADVNAEDDNGETPLHYAASKAAGDKELPRWWISC